MLVCNAQLLGVQKTTRQRRQSGRLCTCASRATVAVTSQLVSRRKSAGVRAQEVTEFAAQIRGHSQCQGKSRKTWRGRDDARVSLVHTALEGQGALCRGGVAVLLLRSARGVSYDPVDRMRQIRVTEDKARADRLVSALKGCAARGLMVFQRGGCGRGPLTLVHGLRGAPLALCRCRERPLLLQKAAEDLQRCCTLVKRSSPSRRCSHDELGSRARAHARSLARAQRLGAIYYTCCTEVVTSCDRIPQPAWPPLMPQMGAGRDRSRRLQRRHPAEAVVPSVVGTPSLFVFFPQWTPLFLGRDLNRALSEIRPRVWRPRKSRRGGDAPGSAR